MSTCLIIQEHHRSNFCKLSVCLECTYVKVHYHFLHIIYNMNLWHILISLWHEKYWSSLSWISTKLIYITEDKIITYFVIKRKFGQPQMIQLPYPIYIFLQICEWPYIPDIWWIICILGDPAKVISECWHGGDIQTWGVGRKGRGNN